MKIDVEGIKRLRDKTGASIADCKMAIQESKGDPKKALDLLRTRGFERAEKKGDRKTSQGLVECYIHQNGRVGAMIEILCETDFVARTSEFKTLAHEISMQVVAMNPKDVDSLLKQEYIRDSSKTIGN